MKRYYIIIITIFTYLNFYAQQDAQYTQYMYNPISINPAYAGSKGNTSIFSLYRTQWVGLEGAPKTANFSINKPIEASKLGYGISVISDNIGNYNENQLSIDLAYNIFFGDYSRLAFGVKASGNFLNVNFSDLNIYNPGETELQDNISNHFAPNIGFGFYYYNKDSYLGVSIPMILNTEKFKSENTTFLNQKSHLYVMGGKVFDLNYNLKFKPAFMTKIVSGSPLQLDLSSNFMLNEKLVLGIAYRWSASTSIITGFQLTKKLFIGYGYDFENTELSNYSSGSHEIFLQLDLLDKHKKIETPRFF